MKHSAGTFIMISREELEEWLGSLTLHGKWKRKADRAGVYLLPFADHVGVQLNSTIGPSDDAMGRGMASMKLSLVSLVTGQTLNKKAMGQDHFKRTLNWRQTWKVGVERLRDAYMKSQGFYDALAVIEDREAYRKDLLAKIEKVPNWEGDQLLADFHKRVLEGGILTAKQVALLDRGVSHAQKETQKVDEAVIQRMRNLYVKARAANDTWLMEFLTNSIVPMLKAGRPLSEKQQQALDRNLDRYKAASLYRRAIRQQIQNE